jgi:predicted KAP-like P-loop ATPase
MLSNDRPIVSRKEDILSRKEFAEHLGKSILSYADPHSLAVGLYGKWGHGKTSILNMVVEYIENEPNQGNWPLIIHFNPWYFSDQNQLFTQFFNTIAVTLKTNDHFKDAKEVGQKLQAYSLCFTASIPIATLDPHTSWIIPAIATTFMTVGKAVSALSKLKQTTPEHLKNGISERLRRLNQKIIIVIDDIDRLSAVEIRQIFQLVKHVADFDNVIYLLAFDKDVIVRALDDVQNGDGAAYLEKIIQVQFEIPAITEKDITTYLSSKVDPIIQTCPKHDSKYLSVLYHFSIKHMLTSLRKVNILVNRFSLGVSQVKEFVQADEFFAINSIQIFYHSLYSFIKGNKDIFSGEFTNSKYSLEKSPEECKKLVDPILSLFSAVDKEIVLSLLSELFPKIEKLYGKSKFGPKKFRKDCAISSVEHFESYFTFSIPEDTLSVSQIEMALSSAEDVERFENHFKEMMATGKISQFLNRILDYTREEIPKENIQNIISVIMNWGDCAANQMMAAFCSKIG